MNYRRRPLLLSNRNQWAVFLLAVVLVGLTVLFHLTPSNAPKEEVILSNYYQQLLDSIREHNQPKKQQIYPFNPNYLSDYRAYQLGIKPEALDRLLAFRKQGKYVNSAVEFKQVTGISDSLVQVLSPYLKFPSWVNKATTKTSFKKKVFPKKDLNTASAMDLQVVRGIGSKLAARIIKFRNYLQGFSFLEQCYDVYGLDSLVVKRLFERFEIQSRPAIEKKALDQISLNELRELPYINNQEARKIIALRTEKGKIGREELLEIFKGDTNKVNRIMLYLF